MLMGQILSPGAKLVSQLTRVGAALASQISPARRRGREVERIQPRSRAGRRRLSLTTATSNLCCEPDEHRGLSPGTKY